MFKIIKIISFVIVSYYLCVIHVNAQTVHFSYDASGNRTNRWVETKDMKDPAADTTFKLGKEFWPTENLLVLSEVKVFPNPVAFDDT